MNRNAEALSTMGAIEPSRREGFIPLAVVEGVVEHGNHLGRELGFPTANIAVPMGGGLPIDGVYAAWFEREDGTVLPGAASLGMRPTVMTDGSRLLEVHVLDVDGWIDLYGERARVTFVEYIRGQVRFDGLDALVAHIARDCDAARGVLLGEQ